MPHQQHLDFIPLHSTFAAEVKGVDFTHPISDELLAELRAGVAQYGVLVFRSTTLSDDSHIAFASRFGPLDDVTPYAKAGSTFRLASPYLFDVSNIEPDGTVAPLTSYRHSMNRGNAMFHVDSSFNPRRAGLSILRAAALPPPGLGGATEFADTRAAWDDLPEHLKKRLREENYVAAHSLMHSRKTASPEALKDVNPENLPMGRHRLAQLHEASDRWNLYIASHVHHIEGLEKNDSDTLIHALYEHACQKMYVVSVDWENEGDLVIWDNTCVMHRATEGDYEGKYARDMRRATVHDTSSQAWGLNDHTESQQGFPWQASK